MRRKRLTSLKETDAFQQPTACEPSKLSKSRPGGKVSDKTSGAQANTERLRRYLRKRQPIIGHNSSQLSSCRMSWLSIFHLKASLAIDACCSGAPRTTEAAPTNPPGCSYTHELQTQRIDTTTRRGTLCTMCELDINANRATAPGRARLPAPARPPTLPAPAHPDGATSAPPAPSSAGAA